MKYDLTIESLPEKNYLAIKGYMSFRDITPGEYEEWERKYGFPNQHLTEQLINKSGATEVYRLFCNSCRKDEQFDWVCGDDIACENVNHAPAGDGFAIIRLAPSDYLKITVPCGNEIGTGMTGEQAAREADEYFWQEWLKNNPYQSKIGGEFADRSDTADITFYDDENRRVIAWHPVLYNG